MPTNLNALEEAIVAVAEGLQAVARSIDRLGNGNAGTQMGAIENLAKELRDGLAAVAVSLESGLE